METGRNRKKDKGVVAIIRRKGADQGAAAIEFVGILPMALIGIGVLMQVMSSVGAAQCAHQAAREASRAYADTGSWTRAEKVAQGSIPGSVTLVSVTPVGHWHGVRVTVRGPLLHRTFISETISQEVEMP